MRSPILRRLFFAVVLAAGPASTACELAFDYDRTILQPVYEAGAPGSDAGDASTDRGRGPDARDGA